MATTDRMTLSAKQVEMFTARIEAFETELPGYSAKWNLLCERLLDLGGHAVVPHLVPESEIDALVSDDLVLNLGTETVLIPMAASNCHGNAARLFESGAGAIVTGYGLSGDGLWRQHSWISNNGLVIETTVIRDLYAGVLVTDTAAFIGSN